MQLRNSGRNALLLKFDYVHRLSRRDGGHLRADVGVTFGYGRRTQTRFGKSRAKVQKDSYKQWRRRRESNSVKGLCRPVPKPVGHVAKLN